MTHYVYLMGCYEYGWFKIGITEDIERRGNEVAHGLPFGAALLAVHEVKSRKTARRIESRLHEHYSGLRINGEWFNYINPADFLKQAARRRR